MVTTFRQLEPDTTFRFASGAGFSHWMTKRDDYTATRPGVAVATKVKPTERVVPVVKH